MQNNQSHCLYNVSDRNVNPIMRYNSPQSWADNYINQQYPLDLQRGPPCYSSQSSQALPRGDGFSSHFHFVGCTQRSRIDSLSHIGYGSLYGQHNKQSYTGNSNGHHNYQGTCYSSSFDQVQYGTPPPGQPVPARVESASFGTYGRYSGPCREQGLQIPCETNFSQSSYRRDNFVPNHPFDQYSHEQHFSHSSYRGRSRSPIDGNLRNCDGRQWSHSVSATNYFNPVHHPPPPLPVNAAPRPLFAASHEDCPHKIGLETLLVNPDRKFRPPKILVILRGLPGSGKSYIAKLIKDMETSAAETEGKSAAIRVLSVDDFFLNDEGKFVYESEMANVYHQELVKLLLRHMDDGYFSFLLVDAVNCTVAELEELAGQARSRKFQVYVIELRTSLPLCIERSAGRRSEGDIRALHAKWEPTPGHYVLLDTGILHQEVTVEEVDMEADSSDEDYNTRLSTAPNEGQETVLEVELSKSRDDDEDTSRGAWRLPKSKWDDDAAVQRLEELDGLKRKPQHSGCSGVFSMAEYLNGDTVHFKERTEGVKRVTWADVEALRENLRLRELGFVVGQTDWRRMSEENDAHIATKALVQIRYI